jgi:ubiquinone/menaquinone biosynthesis C-methylase UbiE
MISKEDEKIYAPYIDLAMHAIDRLLDKDRKPVLLDAGCGHSTVLEDVYHRCKLVLGVDADRQGLNHNKLVDKKIYSDLTKVPIRSDSVDIITSAWVLEHIEDPTKFVTEMDRVLKPGGFFLFIAPNIDGWYAYFASITPDWFHRIGNRLCYKRKEHDTFQTYYRMNSEEDIDSLLIEKLGYRKVRFIYNDDPKYIGFNLLLKPLAFIWHKIVMTDRMERFRVHLIGLYYKPD